MKSQKKMKKKNSDLRPSSNISFNQQSTSIPQSSGLSSKDHIPKIQGLTHTEKKKRTSMVYRETLDS